MSARDGLVYGMDETEYHGGDELSSTGMKTLLDSPARYLYEREHRTEKRAFDIGHAIHGLVLGTGLDLAVVEADSWRTKAAQQQRDEAREAGRVPILVDEYATAKNAADAVLCHPEARVFFEADAHPEVSAFCDMDGVRVRARFDWLLARPVIVDLKSGRTANPRALPRITEQYRYHLQAATYRRALATVRGDEDPAFVHVFVESEPPHLVSVDRLTPEALDAGDAELDVALALYRRCVETGHWPGYPLGIHDIDLPRYYVAPTLEDYL